jgi:hypothetical protein
LTPSAGTSNWRFPPEQEGNHAVLGQDAEVGDLIEFPVNRHKGQLVLAPVERIVGITAYDKDRNRRMLDFDVHVTVVTQWPDALLKGAK